MRKKSRQGVIKRGILYLYVEEKLIFERTFSSSEICKSIMNASIKIYKLRDKGISYFEIRRKRKIIQ